MFGIFRKIFRTVETVPEEKFLSIIAEAYPNKKCSSDNGRDILFVFKSPCSAALVTKTRGESGVYVEYKMDYSLFIHRATYRTEKEFEEFIGRLSERDFV